MHEDLHKALLMWFKQQRTSNTPISEPILKVKAYQLARNLHIENFKCLMGWLDRFKNRHNIPFGRICGEAKDVNREMTVNWLGDKWPKIREGYPDESVFNRDETGLFFKMSPTETLKAATTDIIKIAFGMPVSAVTVSTQRTKFL